MIKQRIMPFTHSRVSNRNVRENFHLELTYSRNNISNPWLRLWPLPKIQNSPKRNCPNPNKFPKQTNYQPVITTGNNRFLSDIVFSKKKGILLQSPRVFSHVSRHCECGRLVCLRFIYAYDNKRGGWLISVGTWVVFDLIVRSIHWIILVSIMIIFISIVLKLI